ncbi:MAG: hypothetical protein U0892_10155 [Pirellulales bacterium]
MKKLFALTLLSVAMVGCGPSETKIAAPPDASTSAAKATLEAFAKDGKMTSALSSLESNINGIASNDSAKGAALKEDYKKLQAATKPEEIKQIASDMLKKL